VWVVWLLTAGLGVWWDVPIHMQNGRDCGPLAIPSHYPIFLGILGFTHAGILSMGLARDPLPRHTLRLAPSWRVPMGALVTTGAGVIALVGFPADDVWHRLFGQDVTEWGPTHVMMIGGAVTCVLGIPLLLAEAAQVRAPGAHGVVGKLFTALAICGCGVPFAFLMEFDLGVPQFPAATQFIIFAFLAAWIGTAVRLWLGPGGALLASAVYLLAHAFLYVTIWALPDVLTARFLLMVPSALIIEAVAAVVQPKKRDRPVLFALVSGVLVGSLGMYCEWLWSKAFMPLPQPFEAHALPLLLGTATVSGLGGSLLALWLVARVSATGRREAPVTAPPYRWFGLAGLVTFLLLMGIFGVPKSGGAYGATISFDQVSGGSTQCGGDERCLARVTVKLDDPSVTDDAVWFYGLAWQGHPKGSPPDVPRDPDSDVPGIVRTELVPTGTPGEYRTADPLPLYGSWKVLLRLHKAPDEMVAFPLYAPDDPAIKAEKGRRITVENGAHIESWAEHRFLQREIKDDVPAWLFVVGYGVVIASWLALLLFYGWCYNRDAQPVASETVRERELV
jgi:hypothetical protein